MGQSKGRIFLHYVRTTLLFFAVFYSLFSCGKKGEEAITLSNTTNDMSAIRLKNESYQSAEDRYRKNLSQVRLAAFLNVHSAKSRAQAVEDLNLNFLGEASDLEALTREFKDLRDKRFLTMTGQEDFLRRLTWLYPDDGCYTRAEYMIRMSLMKLKKIFVFGELKIASEYNPEHEVSWWYHVAPLIRVGDQVFVIDPGVNFSVPTELNEWLTAINAGTGTEVRATLCEPQAYGPYSVCDQQTSTDTRVTTDIQTLLNDEYERVKELDLDPDVVLGDNPPWSLGD